MTTASYPYFVLTQGLLSKKFGVLLSGYVTSLTKLQDEKMTVDGDPDISMGSIVRRDLYTVRVREEETRTGYGSKADLETFYRKNSPGNSLLTLVDHHGNSHSVYMIGDQIPQVLGAEIVGPDAWFFIPCTFRMLS